MSPTDVGFTTSSKEARKAAARSEAAANLHIQRDRSTLYGGLCSNCESLETCTYPSTTSETWFCEEHSVANPPKAADAGRRSLSRRRSAGSKNGTLHQLRSAGNLHPLETSRRRVVLQRIRIATRTQETKLCLL